jgi:hypothetical protein
LIVIHLVRKFCIFMEPKGSASLTKQNQIIFVGGLGNSLDKYVESVR